MRFLLATSIAFLDLASPALAAAPDVTTGDAAPGATTALVNGTVDPNGAPTNHYFEYGTTTLYGLETASVPVDGDGALAVQATLSGLSASTTYHYRLVASNVDGTSRGPDRTFTTTAAPANPTIPGISRLATLRPLGRMVSCIVRQVVAQASGGNFSRCRRRSART